MSQSNILNPYLSSFHKFDPSISVGFQSAAIGSPVRRVTGLGNNPDVDQSSVPEDVWSNGGLYPWMTGATSLEVLSSSAQDSPTGTGVSVVSLTLLDVNFNEFQVNVTLNGTTPVAIPGTFYRINGMLTITKGSGASSNRVFNDGDITVRDVGGGTVRGMMKAGKGIMRQCIFTTPAGYTLQVVSMYIGFNRGTGGGATRYLTATTFTQNAITGIARTALDLSCNGESYRHDGLPGIIVPEKTDFALQVLSVSADNSDITGAFLGIMVRNDLIPSLDYVV